MGIFDSLFGGKQTQPNPDIYDTGAAEAAPAWQAATSQAAPAGILGQASDYFGNNRQALLGLGLGLLSGKGNAEAYQNAMTGYAAGSRNDMLSAAQLEKRKKEQEVRAAVLGYAKARGLSPDQTALLIQSPDTAAAMLTSQLSPKDDRTSDIREYEYARKQGYGGSFNDYRSKAAEMPVGVREYQLAVSQGYPGSYLDYQTQLKQAGRSQTNVNVDSGGTNKQVYDSLEKSAAGAEAAATGLTGLRNARQALQGGAITGFGADSRLMFQKAASALGLADPKAIQNTETFRAAIAPQVAAIMKATVGTTQISNADREFAERAAGGSISLDAGSITRLLDIMERGSTATIDRHNKRLNAAYPDKEKYAREHAIFGVSAADATSPAGKTRSGISFKVEP